MSNPFLSIIIPAHNEEKRLPATLKQIHAFLNTQEYDAEIVVVENGSHDKTLEIAQQFCDRIPYLRVLKEERRGKGLAVRTGILEARGEYRFFGDADLSMPIEEINRFIPPVLPELDIAIGSREAPGAVRYHEPFYRHLIGRVFNSLVRLMALPGLQDTQCGFKCFRAAVAEEIFPLQTFTGMSFDAEDQIVDFGVRPEVLEEVISSGEAFRTRGCEGHDGQVACNRPYANSLPGDNIRNYPFVPEEEDIARIREQLGTVS